MKAIVKSKAEPGLWIEDVPEPELTINDVMIRVKKGGICGTDLHIYNWDAWAQSTIKVPTTIGHEFVGEIVAVGSNVMDFKVGDLVERRGPSRLRKMPELYGGASCLVCEYAWDRRKYEWRVRGIHIRPDDEYLAPQG